MKTKPEAEFPIIIKRGYATVKIYRITNRGRVLYTLAYASPHGRVRENVTDLAKAKRMAASIADKLTREEAHVLEINGEDKQIYVSAKSAVAPTGISLDVAARQFAAAYEILGHDAIVEAARYFKKHVETELPQISVTEAVDKFHEAKKAEGLSPLYLKDIRLMLGDLKAAFQMNLGSVTVEDLSQYLNKKNVGFVAKNNRRRLIIALFNFAKAQGWLSKSEATVADGLGTYKVKEKDVQVFTPAEVKNLIENADADFIPWIALIAFGGIRHEELKKGLAWENIDFKKNTVIVPGNIAKTGCKRKIPMPENLIKWLSPFNNLKGPIFKIDPRRRLEKVTKASKVRWKVNALRHSFGSYRMEQVKNAGQVALEMGNSASIVMKHYFEIIDAAAAQEYWSISPPSTNDTAQ